MPESDHLTAVVNRLHPARKTALSACVFTLAATPAWADDAKLHAYGRHLARECTSCHRIDGVDNGIPSIVGWPTDTFAATIKFYRDGARTNAAMASVAGSLTDQQVEALAVFFASVPKPARNTAPPGEKKTRK
jgi:cytochrome c